MAKKYIDSEKLITEIENIQQAFINKGEQKDLHNAEIVRRSIIYTCNDFLTIIASLQQKQPEVDLEEYIENEVKHYGLSLYEASYGTFSASQIDRIIRNAFELGLNAKKEE